MKMTKTALAIASCALLGACSSWQPSEDGPTYRVGPQYTAKGHVEGVSAYVYGDRTLLQYKSKPMFLTIRDANGNAVDYSEAGNFYRLDRQLDEFRARANLIQATDFKIDPARKAPANPAPDSAPQAQTVAPTAQAIAAPLPAAAIVTSGPDSQPPVKLTNQERDELAQLIAVSRAQLKEVQAAIQQGAADLETLEHLTAKLDAVQQRITSGAAALYVWHFQPNQTNFAPAKEVAEVLAAVAKTAEQINVRGRTDSNAAGTADTRIAQDRAESARAFLVAHGVDPRKIAVSSLGAGDHVAPNTTKQGRDANRRVEIELALPPKRSTPKQAAPAAPQVQKLKIKVRKGSLYENLNELSEAHGWKRPHWNIEVDWLIPQDYELECSEFSECAADLLRAYPVEALISRFDRVIYVKREVY